MNTPNPGIPRPPARRAFTIVEAVISMLVASIMLTGALRAVVMSRKTQVSAERRACARVLADELLDQITRLAYTDPALPTLAPGPEGTEAVSGKAAFNDIDDFNGLTESPPTDRAGTKLTQFAGWTRSVSVAWVDPTNPALVSLTETGAKRITVNVSFGTVPQARRVIVKTNVPSAM